MKNILKTLVFFFAAALIVTDCQKKEEGPTEVAGSFDADHNWTGEVVEISIQGIEAGAEFNNSSDTAVARYLTQKTGVKINWLQVTNEKWALQMSSGDLPDVARINPPTDRAYSTLISAGYLVDFEKYLDKWGPNLKANLSKQLAVAKAVHGGMYVFPTNTGSGAMLYYPMLKWKPYRDAGYPEIHDTDSFIQALVKMVNTKPVTDDGKKVYGVSGFIDWGNTFSFFYPWASVRGYDSIFTFGYADYQTMDLVNQLDDDPRSVYWKTIEMMYKANQAGILDPDFLTQTWEEYIEKRDAEQTLIAHGFWERPTIRDVDKNILDTYAPVPWKGGSVQGGAFNYLYEMGLAITKTCKYPDAVVRLYDYTSSFDGIELIYNGVPGEEWNLVDGKPRPTDAILEAKKAGEDLLLTKGLLYGGANFLTTLSQLTVDPRYDSYVNFVMIPEIANMAYNELEQEVVRHYGTFTMEEILYNEIEKGNMKDMSSYNSLVPRMLAVMPNDITRIQTNVQQLAAAEWAAKVVYARNDAEFAALKAQAIAAFKEAGLDELNKWYQDAWAEAKKKAAGLGI
jgi:multiple sugar transport system substrate-binding protein